MAGVWWLLLLLFGVAVGVAVVVVVVAVVLEVGVGGGRGQLVVVVVIVACCKGGLEDLRTLVWELELELEEAEAEDEEEAQTEAEPDDDDEEEEQQLLVAPDILAAVEEVAAEVIGKPPTTCMGCGGGDNGERLCEERLRGVATGGGDSGISTMGLGERLGTKSD